MKKLNKNILFGLGALGAVAAPVAAVVACGDTKPTTTSSTSSTQQSGGKQGGQSGAIAQGSNAHHISTANMAAWDVQTSTLDLSKITSQFELAKTLAKITNLEVNKGIAGGWLALGDEQNKSALNGKYQDVKSRFEKMSKQDLTIHVKNGTTTTDITLALSKFVPAIIDSITANPDSNAAGFQTAAGKAFADWSTTTKADTSASTSDKDLATKNFTDPQAVMKGEVLAGASLSPISMGSTTSSNDKPSHSVSAFMMADMTSAGSLMKLTHLPEATFTAFKTMLTEIDAFFAPLVSSQMLTDWATANNVNWGKLENGSDIASMPMLTSLFHLNDSRELLNGLFLTSSLV